MTSPPSTSVGASSSPIAARTGSTRPSIAHVGD
ncbi:hypothetical protein H4W81_006388 [Nonomuraea africana]|uniref:Uncharacterized protein n=1 Tax=Nonomuraea africana TaxID=46171 RepID=A0ABR9KNL0_9ACTN|nr:hypothetical protein [Nonomuraea africana]